MFFEFLEVGLKKFLVLPEKLFSVIGRSANYAGWEKGIWRISWIGWRDVVLIFVGVVFCEFVDMGTSTELWWVFSLKKVVCVETVLGAADVLEDILGPQMEIFEVSSITMDPILLNQFLYLKRIST